MFLRCEVILIIRFAFRLFFHHRLHHRHHLRPHRIALASFTSLWPTSAVGGAPAETCCSASCWRAGPSDVTTPPGQSGGLPPVLTNGRDDGACAEGHPGGEGEVVRRRHPLEAGGIIIGAGRARSVMGLARSSFPCRSGSGTVCAL